MTGSVSQVYLMVTDLEKSVRFYREALDLDLDERGDRSAQFNTGACRLKVEQDFSAKTLENFGLEHPGSERGKGAIIVLEVDEVERVHESAAAADAEILAPVREVEWGRELFLVRDPDGYIIEVSQQISP